MDKAEKQEAESKGKIKGQTQAALDDKYDSVFGGAMIGAFALAILTGLWGQKKEIKALQKILGMKKYLRN